MGKPVAIQVAILGPSDTQREKNALQNAISDLSKKTSQYGMTFTPIDWKDAFPSVKLRDPQHDIDARILSSRIFIALFSGKIGRTYGDEIAYTVHEIDSASLLYKRLKHSKNAPIILLYFKKDSREIGSVSEEDLENAIKVRQLRNNYEKQSLVTEYRDENDIVSKVTNALWEYCMMNQGESNIEIGTLDLLFSDLVSEKIITHLEMDMGYSEKIVKLFDKFYMRMIERCEPYYTNLIFDSKRLGDKKDTNKEDTNKRDRNRILYNRFKMFFKLTILDEIAMHENRINTSKEIEVTETNFSEFAEIAISDGFSDFGMSDPLYATHEKHCIENLFADIANDFFRPMSYKTPTKKAMVFLATIVSDATILHIIKTIKEGLARNKWDELPYVFLFSVLESPSYAELELAIKRDFMCHHEKVASCSKKDEHKDIHCKEQQYELLHVLLNEKKFNYIAFFNRKKAEKMFCEEGKQSEHIEFEIRSSEFDKYLPKLPKDVYSLAKVLPQRVFKRGYFLLTSKKTSNRWVDLYTLSCLFNASINAEEYRKYLKDTIEKIVVHQKEHLGINSIIVPRWTCCTEDLFSETLLNVCYALSRTDSFEGISIFELFNAGGESGEYYLSPIEDETLNVTPHIDIQTKAIALLALDIHTWAIDSLLEYNKNIVDLNVISIVGICNQNPKKYNPNPDSKSRKFKTFPLFDVSEYEKKKDYDAEFTYVLNQKFYPYSNDEKKGDKTDGATNSNPSIDPA